MVSEFVRLPWTVGIALMDAVRILDQHNTVGSDANLEILADSVSYQRGVYPIEDFQAYGLPPGHDHD
jgi:hypothetical protein